MSSIPAMEKLSLSENHITKSPESESAEQPKLPSQPSQAEPSDPSAGGNETSAPQHGQTPPSAPVLAEDGSTSGEVKAPSNNPQPAPATATPAVKSNAVPPRVPGPSSSPAPRPAINRPAMTGPMGMRGVMGRGGAPMPTRIPASLQAKMDAVSAVSLLTKGQIRWNTSH